MEKGKYHLETQNISNLYRWTTCVVASARSTIAIHFEPNNFQIMAFDVLCKFYQLGKWVCLDGFDGRREVTLRNEIQYFSTWFPIPDQVNESTIVCHEQTCTEMGSWGGRGVRYWELLYSRTLCYLRSYISSVAVCQCCSTKPCSFVFTSQQYLTLKPGTTLKLSPVNEVSFWQLGSHFLWEHWASIC